MNPCIDPAGHKWSHPAYSPAKTVFHGQRSALVICVREGCYETGYQIEDVAQNPRQKESA